MIEDAEEAIREHPDYPDLHSQLSLLYYGVGRIDEAIEELNSALNLNPRYLTARRQLGLYYRDCGQYEQAMKELEKIPGV